jgi:hypothetical protein
MPGIFNWITENTSKLLDPARAARIKEAAAHIERELAGAAPRILPSISSR